MQTARHARPSISYRCDHPVILFQRLDDVRLGEARVGLLLDQLSRAVEIALEPFTHLHEHVFGVVLDVVEQRNALALKGIQAHSSGLDGGYPFGARIDKSYWHKCSFVATYCVIPPQR